MARNDAIPIRKSLGRMAMHPALKYAFRHALKKAPPLGRRVDWLRAHEQDTPEQIAAAQEQFLRCTLQTAANHLPAYSHLKGRIPREGLREFLHTLPIVDKPTLIADRALYYPNQGRARPWYSIGRTSGSTGTPLDVFRNYDSTRWEQAFCTQHGMWTGWRPGQMQGVLRGDLVVPTSQDKPPYWLHDRAGRQLILSIRHLSKCSIHDVV